jgi:predicted Rossmann fold nucleotide-binding protein DprA/Smf involved in DNA uptake
MRVIIAGSRDALVGRRDIEDAVKQSGFVVDTVISGTARGVDFTGEVWARSKKIPVEQYPAEWELYGKAQAGRIRNRQMADVADALIAIWDGKSSGTSNMIEIMRRLGKLVFVYKWPR